MPDVNATLATMANDADYLALPPAQQREMLQHVTGDKTFRSLSDSETVQFNAHLHTPKGVTGTWKDAQPNTVTGGFLSSMGLEHPLDTLKQIPAAISSAVQNPGQTLKSIEDLSARVGIPGYAAMRNLPAVSEEQQRNPNAGALPFQLAQAATPVPLVPLGDIATSSARGDVRRAVGEGVGSAVNVALLRPSSAKPGVLGNYLKSKFGLSDSYANEVAQKVAQIGATRKVAAEQTARVASEAEQASRTVNAGLAQTITGVESQLQSDIDALHGQSASRISALEQRAASLRGATADLQTRQAEQGREVLADTAHAVFEEHAKAQQPFQEIGEAMNQSRPAAPTIDPAQIEFKNVQMGGVPLREARYPGAPAPTYVKPELPEAQARQIAAEKLKLQFEAAPTNGPRQISDSTTIRNLVTDAVKQFGVQESEIPRAAFNALGPIGENRVSFFGKTYDAERLAQTARIDPSRFKTAEGAADAARAGLTGTGAAPLTFNDLTRVKEDIFNAGMASKDGAVKQGLLKAADQISDIQEKATDAVGLGDKYRAAKAGWMKFRRGAGSGLMNDWLSAKDMEEQALAPKLAQLSDRAGNQALRNILQSVGVDTKPLDAMVAQSTAAKQELKGIPKQMTEVQSRVGKQLTTTRTQAGKMMREARTSARASQSDIAAQAREDTKDIERTTGQQISDLQAKGSIVPGRTAEELAGMSNEQLNRERLQAILTNARAAGVGNPTGLVMMGYGLARLATGNIYGLFPLGYGATRTVLPDVLKSVQFQDWVIAKAGVRAGTPQAIRLRQAIAALAPLAREQAKKVPNNPNENRNVQ